jgi:energy-converting hydrogenase B subunit D
MNPMWTGGFGEVIDIVLAVALVALAGSLLVTKDLFKAVILFIVFGLLMSVVWVRLGAPDIALAEAAIGTGLTAALFLEAVRQIETRSSEPPASERNDGTHHEPDTA